jgi:titin
MIVKRVQTKAWHARRLWAVLAIWLLAVMVTTATAPGAGAVPPPNAPTAVSAVPGNAQATVSWTAPAVAVPPVTGYKIIPQVVGGAALPAIPTLSTVPSGTATGLTNGVSYTFTVVATNIDGDSPPSAASAAISAGAPNAPPGVPTAVPGNGQATVNWTASTTNGTLVTGYKIIPRISPSGPDLPATVVGDVTSETVTGLANGISYTFTVVATSAFGDSPPSAASTPATIPAPAAPDAPTAVTAVPGNGQAIVSWTASVTHGTPVTSYTVFANGTPVITPVIAAADPPPTSVTATGLTNGDPYTFTVVAHSSAGDSAESAPSVAIYVGAPAAPTNVTAVVVPGVGEATVSWTASVENGLPVTGYTVYPSDSTGPLTPQDFPGTGTTATVTGLTGGTAYTFQVQAYTATTISSPSSAPSNSVTPTTPPGPPTSVTAVSGNGQATVSWVAPVANGGSPVTGYQIIPQIVGGPALPAIVVDDVTSATVTGLANGISYTFTVVATNAVGDSVPSAASGPVIPAPAVPSAPTDVTAVPGNGEATVSWTASVTNGMPVTGYTVTAWGPVGITTAVSPPQTSVPGDVTSATVTGLTNGTPYTFTVVAHSTVGDSAPSLPSEPVVPGTPAAPTNVTAVVGPGLGEATVTWTAAVSNGLPVLYYSVVASDGIGSLPPVLVLGTTTATVPGLIGGTAYTFTVQAWSDGLVASPVSAPSNSVTAITVPSPPTDVSATAGNSTATVTWTASADPGTPVTGYQIIPQIVGGIALPATVVGVGTSGTVTGLSNGVSYTFTVVATSAVGDSVPSLPSAPVTPAATAPEAPTEVLAVPGDEQVTVSWTASIENGTPVTGYTVTPSDGTGPLPLLQVDVEVVTTATVPGLTNGTAYTFTVVAHSAAGDSAASTPSAPVTPSENPITAYWNLLGGLDSYLRAPVGPEYDWSGGRGQDYEGGAIYWSADTGAHAVQGAILVDYKTYLGSAVLGLPTNDETPTGDGVGRFNHFSGGGAIYWTPDTGAHAVYGAIYEKWVEYDWEYGRLGYPTTDETATPDGVGRFNHFAKGASIYFTPDTGAHAIYGAIRAKWEAFDWEKGVLGYPTNDESATGDGVGRFSHFTGGGSIYWTPSTGANAVYGAIYNTWAELDWEYGRLGYPTSDEYGIPGGRRSNFVGGTISWRPSTGTSVNYY